MQVVKLGTTDDSGLAREIRERTGEDVNLCMQCGKCTGGCPMSFLYDLSVNQIMHYARQGLREELLSSKSIWLCASCHTCSSRCPAGIDVSAVLECLRHMAREEGFVADRRMKQFADQFLETLKRHGRIHEVELLMRYNLMSGMVLTDAILAPGAFMRGKIHLGAPKVEGKDAVARIIQRFEEGRK